jgi:phosphatidylserine/phosphatidylglycerophosphate/cardiolipin synthase-like enzyme
MRVIRKSATASGREAIDLLASLFALELLRPSRCLWIISPWVTDLPIIDNRFGGFPSLHRYGRRMITLAEVLVTLAVESATIVVATRQDAGNAAFTARLTRLADDEGVAGRVTVVDVSDEQRLHDKALAGDDFVVSGSMNFTFAGALLNEEQVQLHSDETYVAATQKDLYQRFGGVLG